MVQLILAADSSVSSSGHSHVCEHPGCQRSGWFGFSDGVENHWYCTAHKDQGEDECRFERLKNEETARNV